VREEVEALKQAQAHTAQGLTYLATVSHPTPFTARNYLCRPCH